MPFLRDFLKCEKVRCVADTDFFKEGEEYTILDVKYRIEDKHKNKLWYSSDNCFEPVLETEKPASEPLPAENGKPEFRAGQKVYIPWMNDGKIVTLEVDCNGDLCANTLKGKQDFDKYGVSFGSPTQPDLFHATQENHELLSKLMPWLDFEAPPKKLTGSDLCRALIANGWKYVIVKTANGIKVVKDFGITNGLLVDINGLYLDKEEVIPLDPKTGSVLTSEVLGD